ncbi:MAG: phosphoribosylformylglycinamidine cyclo-ligase [Clostridiales Family XIII bacterium]|nr:phosphoribosylformylglycinamidine cyclo-ligase [Clostridiales Family XIII bacterium]
MADDKREGRLTYKSAGVDTKEGERAVSLMKEHVKKTYGPNVLTGLGGFGSLYRLDAAGMKAPVLVAGADGVGTKLKLAFMMDKHDTVGQDCVAMCVNDVLCQGAAPLFFLDYIASGKVRAERIAEIVKGVADGCLLAGCALVGGETAEMPDFYREDEYDMAGFAVGLVDADRIIDGSSIAKGDTLIGIPSSGLHSNGFSLVRRLFFDKLGMDVGDYIEELGTTLGEALLTPTRIYASVCRALMSDIRIKGMVHVTGGGFFENIPRVMPEGLGVEIRKGSWEAPPIFGYIQKVGAIDEDEMYATFNMGVGMIMAVAPEDGARAISLLERAGEKAYAIGTAIEGKGVAFC